MTAWLLALVALSAIELEAPGLACPDGAALSHEVQTLLGRDPNPEDPERRFKVQIRPRGAGLEAHIELHRGARKVGERDIFTHAMDCHALCRAAALYIAIAVDPLAAMALEAKAKAATQPSSEPKIQPSSKPATQPSSEPATRPAAQPASPLSFNPLIAPRLGIGDGPGGTIGLRLGLELSRGAFHGALALRRDFIQQVERAEGAIYSQLSTLEGELCQGWGDAPWACGVLGLGAQRVGGSGFSQSHSSAHLYMGAGARFGWRLPVVEGWSLSPTATLMAPLRPTILRVDGSPAWESPPLSLDLGLRLSWRSRRAP